MTTETRECAKHGLTVHYNHSGYFRCRKCNREHVAEYRRRIKDRALEYMGGKCSECGYIGAHDEMDFHHLDSAEKDFTIGNRKTLSWSKIRDELDKCVLLCGPCHQVHHRKVNSAGLRAGC